MMNWTQIESLHEKVRRAVKRQTMDLVLRDYRIVDGLICEELEPQFVGTPENEVALWFAERWA